MRKTSTVDFEKVIRQLEDTAQTLKILAASDTVDIVARLLKSSATLREALAQSIAGLHPDRPYDIEKSRYISTRDFLDRFDHVFTVPGGAGKTTSPEAFSSLIDDVEHRLFDVLPDDTWFYPGHGDDSTLGAQRPHLPEWRQRGWWPCPSQIAVVKTSATLWKRN
ncbi:protein of unknown function [Streptoalloteichus hindustanus]|uniref:Metallo-beta-lactamase superfamily protein n=2 Tax=Streptoalloteichus hindustanus TaxID=2017 RepID=A0A1M5HGU1_STRHI|nr:protein of unknown function [Streptoalloteichus hindustanus]